MSSRRGVSRAAPATSTAVAIPTWMRPLGRYRASGARAEAAGGFRSARATGVHAAFVSRRLSPGGRADLMAMTLGVDALKRKGASRS